MNSATTLFFQEVAACLLQSDVETTLKLGDRLLRNRHCLDASIEQCQDFDQDLYPGFPQRPELVSPKELPRRGFASDQGRIAFIHAIAHIEYNAIHLAWDAVYRFRGLPAEYYHDWMNVAADETRHFRLLQQRLRESGHEYGDLPAHDGLWQVAHKSRHDPLIRMALVPRVLEARGLDVTPAMIDKLNAVGDNKTAEILEIIYQDEIGHVQTGSRWFYYLCQQRDVDPDATFQVLIEQYYKDGLRGPFNLEARARAGFRQTELQWMQEECI